MQTNYNKSIENKTNKKECKISIDEILLQNQDIFNQLLIENRLKKEKKQLEEKDKKIKELTSKSEKENSNYVKKIHDLTNQLNKANSDLEEYKNKTIDRVKKTGGFSLINEIYEECFNKSNIKDKKNESRRKFTMEDNYNSEQSNNNTNEKPPQTPCLLFCFYSKNNA